jgi:hypothetical protein
MLILNFTYPLRCRRVPLGVRVPPVEYHCPKPLFYFTTGQCETKSLVSSGTPGSSV